jgi:hypothetical protein
MSSFKDVEDQEADRIREAEVRQMFFPRAAAFLQPELESFLGRCCFSPGYTSKTVAMLGVHPAPGLPVTFHTSVSAATSPSKFCCQAIRVMQFDWGIAGHLGLHGVPHALPDGTPWFPGGVGSSEKDFDVMFSGIYRTMDVRRVRSAHAHMVERSKDVWIAAAAKKMAVRKWHAEASFQSCSRDLEKLGMSLEERREFFIDQANKLEVEKVMKA